VDVVVRTAFRARWLPRHVLALVLITALILLGRWQWDVSESARGGLQNLLYAFQWWAMALMVGYGWWRLLRDDTLGRVAMNTVAIVPTSSADDGSWASGQSAAESELAEQAAQQHEADPDLDDYNEYLARLNSRAERAR
jgi:DNA-binding transcriptional regulator of glucitol operon